MTNIKLTNLSARELRHLKLQILVEEQLRLEGERVTVWKISVNGGTSWYKDYKLFSKDIKELAGDYTEQDDMHIDINKTTLPLKEVNTWIGDCLYEDG